jgi:RND family efflux transporter MFP subunit
MNFARHSFGFAVALCVPLLASCGKTEKTDRTKSNQSDAAPRAVRVATAALRPMERTLQVVGTLSAFDETTVAAQVAGQLEKFRADLGDRVTAGQELALIDTSAYEAFTQQSAANLAKARANATNAAQNLQRIRELQTDRIASASDLDGALAAAAAAQAEVKAVEAADAIARLDLERSRVKAPFDGAIAERIASLGRYVAVGDPIVRVVKTDPLRLRVEVPERDSVLVRLGQKVRVGVEGDTNIYRGQLARVAPAIRETNRMLSAEADIPAQGGLRPGLFARVEIIINTDEMAVSVPVETLVTFAGLEKVVTIKEGKAVEQTVKTGRRGPNWVEITSGLEAGQPVVLDPAGLRTGQPVSVATTNSHQPGVVTSAPVR